jgi:hypothetical protein
MLINQWQKKDMMMLHAFTHREIRESPHRQSNIEGQRPVEQTEEKQNNDNS